MDDGITRLSGKKTVEIMLIDLPNVKKKHRQGSTIDRSRSAIKGLDHRGTRTG